MSLRKFFLRNKQVKCDTAVLSQENANAFITDINSARFYNKKTKTKDLINSLEKVKEISSNCYDDLNYYYKLKKGYEIKENLQVAINYYEDPSDFSYNLFRPYNSLGGEVVELNELFEEIFGDRAEGMIWLGYGGSAVIPKTYLSNDHINPSISFQDLNNAYTVEITEELAKEFKERIKDIKENNTEMKLPINEEDVHFE